MNWSGAYPTTHEAVDEWRVHLQREVCLNDAARAAVAEAARVLDALIDALDGLAEAHEHQRRVVRDLEGDDENMKAYERAVAKLIRFPVMRADEIRRASKLVKEHLDTAKGANDGEASRREMAIDQALEADQVDTDDWASTETPDEN